MKNNNVALPLNSSDFNPIEKLFAKLKALLRKAAERTVEGLWPDLNTRFLQTIDYVGIPAKFKLAWHYALGGRGVFLRIWTGVAAVDGPGGRGTAGRHGRI